MPNITLTPDGNTVYTSDAGETTTYNNGDISFVIVSTALVLIMSFGIGLFYAGLLRRKNSLSMLWMSSAVFSVTCLTWWFWGYSLAFSENVKGNFIGDLSNFAFMNVDAQPSVGGVAVPALVYGVYQMTFAAITPVIACGAFADRARLGPILIFTFFWSTIVYSPIACWTWNVGRGWSNNLGGLDFAGGTPVHISSGTAALAISIFLGKRKGYGTDQLAYRPSNVILVVLGTVFLLFGWVGFNGGSALGANLRAMQATFVTIIAAVAGGLTWMVLDYRLERKWSTVGLCSGIISGLVAITPASGYVSAWAAVVLGVVGALASNFATGLKGLLGVDDTLDIFAAHAAAGMVGTFFTGILADWRVASFDGSTPIPGGAINGNPIQMAYQLADLSAGFGWSFTVTMILLFAIDRIPYCHFRASEEDEILGIDLAQIGEEAFYIPLPSEFTGEEERTTVTNPERPTVGSNTSDSFHEKKAPLEEA